MITKNKTYSSKSDSKTVENNKHYHSSSKHITAPLQIMTVYIDIIS